MDCIFKSNKNGNIFYRDIPSSIKDNFCIENDVTLLFTSTNAMECIEYMNSHNLIQKTPALETKNI